MLKFVNKNLTKLILLFLLLGLIFGKYLDFTILKPLIIPLLIFMIFPMMINLKLGEVIHIKKREVITVFLSFLVNFALIPLYAYIISFFLTDINVITGIILISAFPAGGMTAAWVGINKGDMKMALVLIATNLLAAIIFAPIIIFLTLKNSVSIDILLILKQVSLVVLIPLIVGQLIRTYLVKKGKDLKHLKPRFQGISSISVLFMVFLAMGLKAKSLTIYSVPKIIIPLLAFYFLLFLTAYIVGKYRMCSSAVFFSTSMRNLTIALALAVSYFDPLTVIPIALAFTIQVPLGSYFSKKIKF